VRQESPDGFLPNQDSGQTSFSFILAPCVDQYHMYKIDYYTPARPLPPETWHRKGSVRLLDDGAIRYKNRFFGASGSALSLAEVNASCF
jgi:hypothetical protein